MSPARMEAARPLSMCLGHLKNVWLSHSGLAKKKRFSENAKKQNRKIAKIQGEMIHRGEEFIHKLSMTPGKNHPMTVLEDLKLANRNRWLGESVA